MTHRLLVFKKSLIATTETSTFTKSASFLLSFFPTTYEGTKAKS